MKSRRTPEQQRFIEEIRRSNAAQPHRNRKRYSRKVKHSKGAAMYP